jgi:TRAP-type C4-dicarboxylate transport system substrate-binding protein
MSRIILALAGAVLLASGAAAGAAETVLRISHQLPPQHLIARIIEEWAAEIEAASEARIDVQIFGAAQAFKPDQNHPAVAKGDIEMALSVNFQWGNTIPEMSATLKPFAVTDIEVLRRWPGSPAAELLEQALAEKGVVNVMWLFTTNTAAITSSGKPLVNPQDFAGVKIRGLNAVVDAGLQALGAAPAAMPGSEVYQALQTRVIDAGLTDVSAAVSRRFYEVQDYATVTPLFSVFFHGYANPRWWDGLDPALREIVAAASARAEQKAIDVTLEEANAAPDVLREKGMKVHIHTAEEIAAMQAIMDPAFSQAFSAAAGERGARLMELIAAM